MIYNVLVLSNINDVKITNLQKHINYDLLYLNTFQAQKIKEFDPHIVVIQTQKKDIDLLNSIDNCAKRSRKILIYDKLERYDYVELNHFNVSSIMEIEDIKEQLDGAVIKAIYEYSMYNSAKYITVSENVTYDIQKNTLIVHNQTTNLSAIQKKFLEFILIYPNNIHDYDTIINEVWDEKGKPASRSSLKNLVAFFNKLYPNIIENHYGLGYKLNSGKDLNFLSARINYLEILNDFHDKFFSSSHVTKETIQNALDELREIFQTDRVCLCANVDLRDNFFHITFLSVGQIHPFVEQNEGVPLVRSQRILLQQVIDNEKSMYYNENALLIPAMETSTFITKSHKIPKSMLVGKFICDEGKVHMIALHDLDRCRSYDDTDRSLFEALVKKFKLLFELYERS